MLSLPHCVATLGWIVGLSAVAAFGALSAYSGVILTRTKMNLFPDAESFGDLCDLTTDTASSTRDQNRVVWFELPNLAKADERSEATRPQATESMRCG